MTANQIAAASVREGERHNQVYEQETQRHNQAAEDLQSDANRITEEHHQRADMYAKEYNDSYLAYLKASEEDKVYLESQLNDIKQQMADNDKWYNNEMAMVNRRSQEADERYKNAMATINAFDAAIEAKRAYYEGQKTENVIWESQQNVAMGFKKLQQDYEIAMKNYEARVTEINNAYQLGMISAETKSAELHLAKEQFDENVKRWNETYATQESEKTKLIQQQQKTEGSKRANLTSSTVKNYVDIPAGLIDSVMPF